MSNCEYSSTRWGWKCDRCGKHYLTILDARECCEPSDDDKKAAEKFEEEKDADRRAGIVGYDVDLSGIFNDKH